MAYGTLSGTASRIFFFLKVDSPAGLYNNPTTAFQIRWWGYAVTSGGVLITDTLNGTVYRDAGGIITFDPTNASPSSLRSQVVSATRTWYGQPTATVINLLDTSGLLGL